MSKHVLAVVLINVILAIFCVFFGLILREKDFKNEAIKNKMAEYRCDPETGKTMFCWKTNEVAIKADKTVERVWHACDWSPVEKEYRHNKATCPECNPKMRTKEN